MPFPAYIVDKTFLVPEVLCVTTVLGHPSLRISDRRAISVPVLRRCQCAMLSMSSMYHSSNGETPPSGGSCVKVQSCGGVVGWSGRTAAIQRLVLEDSNVIRSLRGYRQISALTFLP